MNISMTNVPAEWKVPRKRATCKHCKTALWTKDGRMPKDHDRPDGRVCRRAAR